MDSESHRGSRFSQSPTVVPSPATPAYNGVSFPLTPVLQVDMDRIPFSKSFPEIIKRPAVSFPASGCAGMARVNRASLLNHSDSFHIEHIPNVKEIDPDWEHDEIEEIMVISPKPKVRNSFLDLGATRRLSIDDFEVLRVVGKEPSIQTILARSCSDFGVYTIKTIGKRSVSAPNILKHVRSEQTCLRIVTEGHCPFLPKLHRSFHDEARLYMVLDTYPGGSIALHLDREGPFAADKARFYACEIVEALSYLHSLQVVHRDVKPENVMITADGHVVLTNFSCAKVLDDSGGTSSDCGTRVFEAPERILGWSYDYSVDVWSFGIFLCIMHFGQHPFLEGDELDPLLIMQKRILRGQGPKHPTHIVPLSEWNLIKKCLERNAHLRPEIAEVKTHEYFSDIDWDRVKNKGYQAPYVPYGDEVDLLGIDEDIFHCYETSDLLELDDNATVNASDFDGFTFSWGSTAASPGDESLAPASPGPAVAVIAHPEKKNDLRSILRRPSIYFSGDSKSADASRLGDFLDLRRSSSHTELSDSTRRPRLLRKKLQSGSDAQISCRKSVISLLSDFTPSKGGANKSAFRDKFSKKCESSISSGPANLPGGIFQAGQGIGFTYAPQASRSHLSLSSVKTQSCFKSISVLFGRRSNQTGILPKSRNEVMQHIYGSTWSVHTNEAQMSMTSFGIPEGLGRRVDSIQLQRQQPLQP